MEDEALIALHESNLLRKYGFKVKIAYNAEKAFEAVEQGDIDLILMDIDLGPGKPDGTDAAEKILAKYDIPIVFLSSHTEPAVVEKAEKINSYGYIVKNCAETVLIASVNTAFNLHETHRELMSRSRLLLESISDSVFVLDREWRHLLVNDAAEVFTGFSKDELLGARLTDLFPGIESTEIFHTFEKAMDTGISEKIESSFTFPDGREGWYELFVYPVPAGILCISRDITKRKHDENQIRKLLTEKDFLLQEVHHRVKNNMSIVAGLLSLQMQSLTGEEAKAALREAKNRMDSVQRLYDRIYNSSDYSEVNLGEYINDFVQELIKVYGNERVTVYSNVEKVQVAVKYAIPVGIILNELVTNSMKYAFPSIMKGAIDISLHQRDDEAVELSVVDDGVGFPANFDLAGSNGFGLTVVKTLVQQIEGKIEPIVKPGTGFSIVFYPER